MIGAPATLPLGGVLGLIVGSYAVTAGLRLSRGEGSTHGRSRCDGCGTPLSFVETIPVAAYFSLGGSCRSCGEPIDPLHVIGEISGAAILMSLAWLDQPVQIVLLGILGFVLLAAAAVDLKIHRLPNALVGVAALCCAALALSGGLDRLQDGVLAAGAVTALLLSLRWIGLRCRGQPGLGMGDVKLIAAVSLWLGRATPIMLIVATTLGLTAALLIRVKQRHLPFGPAIAPAAWIVGLALEYGWHPWAP